MIRRMKRLCGFFLTLALSCSLTAFPVFAKPDWPADTGVQSEAGIVMDMDSGAVLFAQNIHVQLPPASITKLLTALVVAEHASMDEQVTFSHDAVYNVESGSGNKLGLEEGDVLSVKDSLSVMLLQSSNQAANALAEHVAGSREAFADMMNEKAEALGCRESNFENPSGLNDEAQLTSAYDMALIGAAAFSDPEILEICSAKKATLPPTKNNTEGRTYSLEHKLVVTEDGTSEYYYPEAVAGKTGYTSLAGQTLVTYAVKDDRRQVAVTLKSTQKTHYSDTKTILDFCFARFKNVNIADNEIEYVTGDTPVTIAGETYDPSELSIDSGAVITIPHDAQFTDADKALETDLPEDHPQEAVARLVYTYNERRVGDAWIYSSRAQAVNATPSEPGEDTPQESQPEKDGQDVKTGLKLPRAVLIGGGAVLVLALIAGGGVFWFKRRQAAERERQRILREKRRQRLADIGYTEEDFERLLDERRKQHDMR